MMKPTEDYVICPCGTDVPQDEAVDGVWCSVACKEDPDVLDYLVDPQGPWMTTFVGKRFYPMSPKLDDVCIEDIAHALSNCCRWSGHTTVFYSVAQHCVLTSLVADRPYRMAMLLHDAAEAYMGDLVRPLKRGTRMGQTFAVMEDRIQEVILEAFNVVGPSKSLQRIWDNRVLLAEADDLINQDWISALRDRLKVTRWPPEKIQPLAPAKAKRLFMNRYLELSRTGS